MLQTGIGRIYLANESDFKENKIKGESIKRRVMVSGYTKDNTMMVHRITSSTDSKYSEKERLKLNRQHVPILRSGSRSCRGS